MEKYVSHDKRPAPLSERGDATYALGEDSGNRIHDLILDQQSLAASYGKPSVFGILKSPVVAACALAAASCGFLYGYDQGLVNVTLDNERFLAFFPEMNSALDAHAAFNKGLMTAIFELGAVLGALQSAFFCDRISRRYSILVATSWYLVGSVLQAASQNYTMLIMGRLIGGLGVGGASMIAPLYINEIAPPHIRGSLYTLQQWMLILGIVAAFIPPTILPGLVLSAIVTVLPFSPRWLSLVRRDAQCLKVLAKLRGLPEEDVRVQAEWIQIRAETIVQAELTTTKHQEGSQNLKSFVRTEANKWRICFAKKNIKRVHVGVVINLFQQWVGVNGFTYYSTTLFRQLGYGSEEVLTLSGLLCVCQLVGATVPIFIIDRVGRRPLLLLGTFVLLSCHAINAGLVGVSYNDWSHHSDSARTCTAFMFLFMFFFEISWGPIAWGLPGEILPGNIRAQGMALSASSNWLNNFVVGLIVPSLVQQAPYGSFTLFSCTTFLALVWVYFFVVETKGKTIEELSAAFGDEASLDEGRIRKEILDRLCSTFAPRSDS